MDIVFLITALGSILFGIALMVLYRPGKLWNKPYPGMCFSPILGGVCHLAHRFDPLNCRMDSTRLHRRALLDIILCHVLQKKGITP